jgi:hypothetical protein
VGLRGKLRRLERGAREDLASFIVEDGSRYYNPESGEYFLHACACIRAGSACLEYGAGIYFRHGIGPLQDERKSRV